MTKDQMQQVLDALTDARKFVNMGFEADEDVYGVHHNDATDAVGYIEQAIAIMQAALAQQVQPSQAPELNDTQRIDFLDANKGSNLFSIAGNWYTRSGYGQPYKKRKSLRDAVDAAINAKGATA